jgi:hypothetical protein
MDLWDLYILRVAVLVQNHTFLSNCVRVSTRFRGGHYYESGPFPYYGGCRNIRYFDILQNTTLVYVEKVFVALCSDYIFKRIVIYTFLLGTANVKL